MAAAAVTVPSFKGIGTKGNTATYKSAGVTAADFTDNGPFLAVTVTGDSQVGKGSTGNAVHGGAYLLESDGLVGVQTGGYVTFRYSGTAPTAGAYVECDGTGKVKAVASGVSPWVVVTVDASATTLVALAR